MLTKNVNGVDVPLSDEDLAQREADQAAAALPVVPRDVSFWQFMLGAASLGIITLAEAEAAVDTRAMPTLFADTLDALPEPARTMARIKFKGITRVERDDELFGLMIATGNATEAQIAAVFTAAAAIE